MDVVHALVGLDWIGVHCVVYGRGGMAIELPGAQNRGDAEIAADYGPVKVPLAPAEEMVLDEEGRPPNIVRSFGSI